MSRGDPERVLRLRVQECRRRGEPDARSKRALRLLNVKAAPALVPIVRVSFDFQPTAGRPPLDWRERTPPGFAIRPMDSDLAQLLDADLGAAIGYSWFDTVWGGVDEFLSNGFGFVAEYDGNDGPRLASNCRQWGRSVGIAPIQVSTRVAFRGRGLATLVGAAFIEEGLKRGLTPEYSCESENHASIVLASKLGFFPSDSRSASSGPLDPS